MGGGDLGAMAVLAGEVGQLIELLDRAGIGRHGRADPRAVSRRRSATAMTRGAAAAASASSIARRLGEGGSRRTPRGLSHASEHWSHLAADGALHCTLWAAEWPRIDVRALFLQPLLMDSQDHAHDRDVHGAGGPARAIRQAERAATETATEQSLRARVGQRTSQRQSQRDRAANQARA